MRVRPASIRLVEANMPLEISVRYSQFLNKPLRYSHLPDQPTLYLIHLPTGSVKMPIDYTTHRNKEIRNVETTIEAYNIGNDPDNEEQED